MREPKIGALLDGKVYRFSKSFVIAHALHSLCFLVLLITGLAVYSPVTSWISFFFGGMQGVRLAHRIFAVPFLLGAVVFLLVDGGKTVKEWLRLTFSWSWSDLDFMLRYTVTEFMDRPGHLPEADFINSGEKLNSLLTILTWLGLSTSGFLLWFPGAFPRWAVLLAYPVHDLCMLLMTAMFIIHAYLSLAHPRMKTALSGILTGWVDAQYAKTHYPRWYQRVTGKDA